MIEELYRLYYKDVYYYILSLCHDQNLSEDLTSDTFYQLMLSQSTFRQQSQIKTWIFSIARHVVYKEFRKMKSIVPYDVSLKSMYYDEYNVYYDEILGYMKELPEVNRIVFQKRLDAYSYEEMAEVCHLNVNSTRVIQHRNKLF